MTRARLWARVGGRWAAWYGTTGDAARVLEALGERVERWDLDTAPTWPVGVAPRDAWGRFGGNDAGIRAAVAGWPDTCATCGESTRGHGRCVWTGHGPECRGCASRYAD